MVTAEYNWKQFELLLTWAVATTDPNLKAKLLLRALEFLALVDDTDERVLCVFQEVLDSGRPSIRQTSTTGPAVKTGTASAGSTGAVDAEQ